MNSKRYLISYPISLETRRILDEILYSLTSKHLSIPDCHISLAYPFFPKTDVSEGTLISRFQSIQAAAIPSHLSSLGIFHGSQRDKTTLYAKVEPFKEYANLHDIVTQTMEGYVETDLSTFVTNTAPKFDPHISLDYHTSSTQELNDKIKNIKPDHSFILDKLTLKREETPGIWKQVVEIDLKPSPLSKPQRD